MTPAPAPEHPKPTKSRSLTISAPNSAGYGALVLGMLATLLPGAIPKS